MPPTMFDPKDLAAAAGPAPAAGPSAQDPGGDDMTCPTCGASAAKILAGATGGAAPEPDGDEMA